MKRLTWIALAALLWSASLLATSDQYVLGVDGLACPFCAYGIEKKLSAIEGVESVETDIETGQVVVILRQGETLSEAVARQAVENAGFSLRSFTHGQISE